jgi:rod shape-determining protein MreD
MAPKTRFFVKGVPLLFFFALALFFALFGSILFPFFPLSSFSPFLAIVYYAVPFSKALWISCGCGFILDFLSSEFHFGVHALTLTVCSALLFHQKKHFFEDKPLAFALLTSLISSVSTLLQFVFIHLLDRGIPVSFATFLTDAVATPLIDGLYGFLWFTCPMRLYIYIKKIGWKKFLSMLVRYEQKPPV